MKASNAPSSPRPAHVWTVVLDDDPTGTQGIRALPVVVSRTAETFDWAMSQGNTAYVLTNTRALSPTDACDVVVDAVTQADRSAAKARRSVRYVSRGDSTLRGHFPLEIQVILRQKSAQHTVGCLLVPAFPDAGRLTLDGIHYVKVDGHLQPVANTEYARDATFGFSDSDLVEWARHRVPAEWLVVPLSSTIVDQGARAVASFLSGQTAFTVVCPSVRNADDLRTLAEGQRLAETDGAHYLVQAGPSYPKVLAELSDASALAGRRLRSRHGLIVVGSHTRTTSEQVAAAVPKHELLTVELDVREVVDGDRSAEIRRCASLAVGYLQAASVVISTSRERLTGRDGASSLRIANQIASALTELTRASLRAKPSFVIAKGGITSRDVVADSLEWEAATVLGPLIDETLPVWESWKTVPDDPLCVIFPGNVGGPDLLSRALTRLAEMAALTNSERQNQ